MGPPNMHVYAVIICLYITATGVLSQIEEEEKSTDDRNPYLGKVTKFDNDRTNGMVIIQKKMHGEALNTLHQGR